MFDWIRASLIDSMDPKRDIIGIQYLRGIAATAVVVNHTAGIAALDKYFSNEILGGFLYSGSVGVDLFFVVSGFIISAISLNSENDPRISMGMFFQKRFARIIPLLWVAILSYAALKLLGRGDFDPLPMLRALTLFPIGELEPNVVWTLRHEALFYTLFALTFLGARRRAWILAGWIIAPMLMWPVVGQVSQAEEFWAASLVNFVTHPVNILFGMGLALGLFWNVRPFRQIKVHGGLLFAALLGGFAVLTLAVHVWQLSFNSVSGVLVTGTISLVLMAGSIKSKIETGTGSRIGILLGSASYSIYLFHLHFVSAILGIWVRFCSRKSHVGSDTQHLVGRGISLHSCTYSGGETLSGAGATYAGPMS